MLNSSNISVDMGILHLDWVRSIVADSLATVRDSAAWLYRMGRCLPFMMEDMNELASMAKEDVPSNL